jgi:hypothetical protein
MSINFNDHDITTSGNLTANSGNFTSLNINNSNFNSTVSGLLPTIANSGDNRVLTSTGSTVGINAESNLTFSDCVLTLGSTGNESSSVIQLYNSDSGDTNVSLRLFDANNNLMVYIGSDDDSNSNEITSLYYPLNINSSETFTLFTSKNLDIYATSGTTLTGGNLRIANQTASTIASFDSNKNVTSLSTATYPSLTELTYVKGVTSAIQTQIDDKSSSTHVHGNITNAGAIGSTANLPLITTTGGAITVGSFGTAANTFCQGNDSRLSDSRTPLSHTHGNITNAGAIGSTANLPLITTTSGAITVGSFGTAANTFCQGNDSRLSDSRAPTGAAGGDLTGTYPNPTLTNTTVVAGTYRSVTVDAKGRITSGTNPTTISGYGITDVGNGTLTLNVSGTGLSGSASFTANQSGNTTFTVTSNATSANTGSTIVARDASGNFSAGTITATLSGSASNATQLNGIAASNYFRVDGTYPNADMNVPVEGYWHVASNAANMPEASYGHRWDYDHAGDGNWIAQFYSPTGGDAGLWFRQRRSGTWQTWRKFLDSTTYNSYSPTLTGTGASGTWGISISGGLTGTNINLGFSLSTATISYGGHAGPQIQSQGGGAAMMSFHRPGAYAVNFGLDSDNVLKVGGWSMGANAYPILHSNNYNSYAPTLTGGNASGTWSINVTGTAAGETLATVTGRGASTTTNITTTGAVYANNWYRSYGNSGWFNETYAGGIWMTDSTWIRIYNNKQFLVDNIIQSGASVRAPIFYDTNNLGYYLDPDSTSNLNRVNAIGWDTTGRNYSREWIEFTNHSGLYSPLNGAHFYPNNASYGAWRVVGTRNGWGGLEFDSTGAGQISLMMNSGHTGVHNNTYGWQWYWTGGTFYVSKGSYGGSEVAVLDSSNFASIAPVSSRTFRAWGVYDGTASSANPGDGINMGTMTRSGTATYTCNFSITLPNANYGVLVSGQVGSMVTQTRTTTSVVIVAQNLNGTQTQATYFTLGIIDTV